MSGSRGGVHIAIALVALTALSLAYRGWRKRETPAPRPFLVIISLDTLRADHISGYGYVRPTSPELDAFAAEAVLFSEARCQSTGTLPSHLSLMTSLYPPHFRITTDDGRNSDQMITRLRLADPVLTLAEVLRAAGYETAAFTDGGYVDARYGFDQGFDTFHANAPARSGLRAVLPALEDYLAKGSASGVNDGAPARRPLFLFIHTYDIHGPYRAPEPFTRVFSELSFEEARTRMGCPAVPRALTKRRESLSPEDVVTVRGLYDNGILATDDQMGRLFESLKAHGLYEGAAVVVLSDHGEEFLEHGDFNHGRTVYEEVLRVPLLVRLPGGRQGGLVVATPVALIDVAPTLAELAGIMPPDQFQGRSLLDVVDRGEDDGFLRRPLYFDIPNALEPVRGILRGAWKLILRGPEQGRELYALGEDPREQRDVSSDEHELCEELSRDLAAWMACMEQLGRERGWFSSGGPSDERGWRESQKQLRALGYVD
jgi:arylsulfatase A-like enzyme